MDTNGNLVKDYQDTTIFGEGSIQKDRSARFTGKPYDEDLQAYVFPYRNYDASTARWRSSDPAGYPDGINQHFYAAVPTFVIDSLGLATLEVYGRPLSGSPAGTHTYGVLTVNSNEYSQNLNLILIQTGHILHQSADIKAIPWYRILIYLLAWVIISI